MNTKVKFCPCWDCAMNDSPSSEPIKTEVDSRMVEAIKNFHVEDDPTPKPKNKFAQLLSFLTRPFST